MGDNPRAMRLARTRKLPTAPQTPFTLRVTRVARLTWLLLVGLYIIAVRFPRLTMAQRERVIRSWSRRLLAILHIRVRCMNEPERWPRSGDGGHGAMIIMNHISWIDIFVILSLVPCVFVAKSEIRSWPLVGRLVAGVGTLFIERGKKSHARRMNEQIVAALHGGHIIAVCPEGGTSRGDILRPFHAALFQPAINAETTIQPVALCYLDQRNQPTQAAAYVDDISLLGCIWNVAGEPRITVEARFAAPIAASADTHRRELVYATERLIATELGVPPPHREPASARNPRV